MKTRILTSVLLIVIMLVCFNVCAQNKVVYDNIESYGAYIKKEFISVDKNTNTPLSKRVYLYNEKDQRVETIEYIWRNDLSAGWEALRKYEYEYSDNDLLIYTICSQWDSWKSKWSDNVEQITYNYNENGELIDVDKINTTRAKLLTILK